MIYPLPANGTVSRWTPRVKEIVSGGQSGVDRGALDAALAVGLPHRGWCPRGRRAEDGPIPAQYLLRPTKSADYRVRTRRNVVHSDGTLIFCCGLPTGGTKWTLDWAICCGRPYHLVDFAESQSDAAAEKKQRQSVTGWMLLQGIQVLNVAGPRASRHRWIAERTRLFMCALLRNL